jgi:uncharacterized membrane protein
MISRSNFKIRSFFRCSFEIPRHCVFLVQLLKATSLSAPVFPTKVYGRDYMARDGFWSGFGLGALTGASAGVAAFMAASGRASSNDKRILRLERSIQIGRSVEDVFSEWSQLETLPGKISTVRRVEVSGQRSNWLVAVDGKDFEFDAETIQVIPNQAIGWKSINGPKHSGRINFARLGDDTLVHVSMNYAPPLGVFARLLTPITDHLESQIDLALRDFKRALEGTSERDEAPGTRALRSQGMRRTGPASAGWDEPEAQRATGTDGPRAINPPGTPGTHLEDRSGNVLNPGAVDYTRPPRDRS